MTVFRRPDFGVHNLIGLPETLEVAVRASYFVRYVQFPFDSLVDSFEYYQQIPQEARAKLTEWGQTVTKISERLDLLLYELGSQLNYDVVANMAPMPDRILDEGVVCEQILSKYVFKNLVQDTTTLANVLEWLGVTLAEINREFNGWCDQAWYKPSIEGSHAAFLELRCRADESSVPFQLLQEKLEAQCERLRHVTLLNAEP